MTDWSAVMSQPWSMAPDTLLGATVLAFIAALVGEVVWRLWRWPRLVGYAATGTVLALTGYGFDLSQPGVRVVVDAALAVLLFEAGARVNLRWLRHNPWLLVSSALEAVMGAVAVYAAATYLGVARAVALPLAIITIASAPAMVLRVVSELRASGQVTERAVTHSALNALYAVVALQLFGAGLLLDEPDTWWRAVSPVAVSFVGALLLAALLGEVVNRVARRFDLRHDNAVLLLAGSVMIALVVAKTMQWSTLLVPLLAGLWLRNRSDRPWVWPQHFGSLGALLVLGLFVIVNASWSLPAVLPLLGVAVVVLVARWLAKTVGVLVLARPAGLSVRQALSLGVMLSPLSSTAWVLGTDFAASAAASAATSTALGAADAQASAMAGVPMTTLMPLLMACMALLELVSPLLLAACLRRMGEVDQPEARAPTKDSA